MNQLTDEQQNLLKFLPDGFEGTKLEKLTMAAFCYCNQSAIERGENQFSLGLIGLKDLTGYNSISKLSIAVKNLIREGYITCLKRGNGIEHINSVYQMKFENIKKEKNNNNTLNSTTDMLMITERLALLSKEIEAMKDDNKTINERLNKAAKIIKELKESVNTLHNSTDSTNEVNLNYYEICNLKKEFSDQFKIAKNKNVAMSERFKAAKIMNSIAYRYPDILTKKQRKAAMALLYVNDNTNVESKSETKAEVTGLQDHSLTKESEYTFKELQENYKGLIKNLQQKNPKYIGNNYNHVKAEVRKEKVLEIYNPLKSIEENLRNIASEGIEISKATLMRYVQGNGIREAKNGQIEALMNTTVSIRENYRRLKEEGMKVGINKVSEIYNKIKNI